MTFVGFLFIIIGFLFLYKWKKSLPLPELKVNYSIPGGQAAEKYSLLPSSILSISFGLLILLKSYNLFFAYTVFWIGVGTSFVIFFYYIFFYRKPQ